MHIPDGFLDAKTSLVSLGLAAAGLGWAARATRRTLPPRKIPLLGVTAAFVFAAQMLNFPVMGGTSGHLLGGVLAAVLLGPGAGMLVIATVLIVQCFLFADGGVLALGANLFNMGLIGTTGAYAIYALVRRLCGGLRGQLMAAAFAGWCSVVLSAAACAAQLAFAHTASWRVAFPAMVGVHMLIGIGEALITALVLAAVASTRPELLQTESAGSVRHAAGHSLVFGLLIALGMAIFLSPLASPWPDGLERAAAKMGFAHQTGVAPVLPAPIPDYTMPGMGSAARATAVAGGVGTLFMLVFAWFLARIVTPRAPAQRPTPKA